MLDFTMRHLRRSLRPLPALTAGRPATLEPPASASGVARQFATLQGFRTVLVRGRGGLGAHLAFLLTSLHQPTEIDRVIKALDGALASSWATKLSARTS